MDHHELDLKQKSLSKYVTEIIDHHDDAKFQFRKEFPILGPYIVKFPRCSALSLILEILLTHKGKMSDYFINSLKDDKDPIYIDFLTSALILDSTDFDKKSEGVKWINTDMKILHDIWNLNKRSVFADYNQFKDQKDLSLLSRNLYSTLSNIKFSPENNLKLDLRGIFNKDRKEYEVIRANNAGKLKIAFSSLAVGLDKVVEKYGDKAAYDYLNSVAASDKIDFFVIIYSIKDEKRVHFYVNNSPNANILGLATFEKLYQTMKTSFEKSGTVKDIKFEHDKKIANRYTIFSTGGLSRKLVWPEVQAYFSKI